MPFDGFYQPNTSPVWEDRLRRLAEHTAGLECLNLRSWELCAIGQAMTHGVLDGLYWDLWAGIPAMSPTIKGWTAVELYFGMTRKEARKLFCNRWFGFEPSPTPKVMAKRIHAYIDQRWMAVAA